MALCLSPARLRRIILEQSFRAAVGHIGSALSVADIVASLYGGILSIDHPSDSKSDLFVLSKGHAALALYGALHLRGWLDAQTLNTFCADGTLLGVHPDDSVPGIDYSTGSLGQGLSFAAGVALGWRLRRIPRRVFVLMSDAECNAGPVWEAVMFAAHHRLSNLIVIVDLNGQQAFGYTDAILSLSPLTDRWRAFGWDTRDVNGHDVNALSSAAAALDTSNGPPHVLVAATVFGKGVSFMERQIRWHYDPMSDDEYRRALAEIGDER